MDEQLLAELQPAEDQDYYNRSGTAESLIPQTTETTIIEEEPLDDEPEEIDRGSFPAAFGSRIGQSTIDLSDENNAAVMKQEYNEWWNLGKKRGFLGVPYVGSEYQTERNGLKDRWYRKYHGMTLEEYEAARTEDVKKYGGFYPGANDPIGNLQNTFQGLSVPGLAYADFFMDAAGTVIPGMDKVDDRWDEATQLDNPIHQNIRRVLSIVLPAIHTGGATNKFLAARGVNQYPFLTKHLTRLGAFGLADGTIALLSDTSEDDNAVKVVADLMPGLFGQQGMVPLPESWKTKSSNSPSANKWLHFWENFGLAGIGSILGAFIDAKSGVKNAVEFIEPLDEASAKYKQMELIKLGDEDDLIRLQEIDTLLSSGKVNRQVENQLINEIIEIEQRIGRPMGADEALRRKELGFQAEANAAARRKLSDPNVNQLELGLDGDIQRELVDPSSSARSSVPPANVARNIADTTAIKSGNSIGDPAPIITEAMREKGLMIGSKSRDAVMGVAEETRDIGRFNAVVDGIRYSAKQMNAAAWDIYTSIIAAENIDDVRQLFVDNRDVKNFLMGRFKVEVFNEEQARAAAFALRDLTDRFVGREVSEASARVMDTLGRESATLAEAIQKGGPYVDDARVMDLIIDKMQFLLDEYALNKYLAGWSLRNKNWFDQVPPKELDDVIEQLTQEFSNAENAIHARNLRFTETLKEIKKTKPHFLRPLVDAYAHTNGNVDTLAKLNTYAAGQISPLSMLKSPDPKQMSLFAKAAWSVVMNNVLSGLSAIRAAAGNAYQLTVKPITQVLGHGFWGAVEGDFTGVKMTMYANGAIFETNRRALDDAFTMMKKAHKDPEMMMKAYRKDFQLQTSKEWDIADGMREAWEVEGNYGKILQHDLASGLRDLGAHPAMRYGMTGLVFPDAYTSTMLAHYLARVKAYDDVVSELGFFKRSAVLVAEARYYKNFFDNNGLIKDDVLRAIAGEVQLNLDDGLASWLNKGTTAYPMTKFLMMFPRTSSNAVKNAASWTPLSLIPGFNKYSKTIYARTADDIAIALAEHGIDMATEPNAMAIFKNLRAEYTGRIAFSGLMVGTLWQYAMAGNIRGNGNYNQARRSKERDQLGYEPLTIKIGNKWVSYKGIIGLQQVLATLGDMAYYASDLNEPMIANWHAKLAWSISASFLNETPLQGFEPLIAITNGDISGWNRLIANTTRSMLPLSGGAGVVANAISSTQKDIEGEVHQYIANRLPGFNLALPEQIDIWTGEALNDIHNPFLRMLNAISPYKISGTSEPWRQWLQEIQFDGLSRLTRDSTGIYEYTAKEREYIYKKIGSYQMYKEIQKIMKNPKYNEQVAALRAHRTTSVDSKNEMIELKKKLLPVYQAINNVIKDAQQKAEFELLNERPDIVETINLQQYTDQRMKQGDVEGAADMQEKQLEKQKLLQYGGAR